MRLSGVLTLLFGLVLGAAQAATLVVEDYNPRAPGGQVTVGEQNLQLFSIDGRMSLVNNAKITVLDDDAEAKGGKAEKLVYDGTRLYAFWWVKLGNATKRLYVRVSEDQGKTFAPLVRLNQGGGVLPDYEVVATAEGKVGVLYLDERMPSYQIFFNHSLDGGKTWLKQDLHMNVQAETISSRGDLAELSKKAFGYYAFEPHLHLVDNRLIAFWKDAVPVNKENKNTDAASTQTSATKPDAEVDSKTGLLKPVVPEPKQKQEVITRLATRVSDDFGLTWRESNVFVNPVGQYVPVMSRLYDAKSRGLVMVASKTDGIQVYTSKDKGDSWQEGPLYSLDIAVASWDDMNITVAGDSVFVAFDRIAQNAKFRTIHYTRYDLKTKQWDIQRPIFTVNDQNVALTRSEGARLHTVDDSNILIAYNDRAYVKPVVMIDWLTFTKSGWELKSRKGIGFNKEVKSALDPIWQTDSKGQLWLQYLSRHGYATIVGDLMQTTITLGEKELQGEGLISPPEPQEDTNVIAKQIEEKLKLFWEAKEADDVGTQYNMFDPFFRSRVNMRQYLGGMTNLIFKKHKPQSILINPLQNRATTVTKVSYEVPPRPTEGRLLKTPMAENILTQHWILVDGEWYVEYRLGMSEDKSYADE